MSARFLKVLWVFILLLPKERATGQVTVYSNATAGDSISIALNDFFTQTAKAGIENYLKASASSFSQKGILILKTDEAVKQKVNFPVKLKQYGPEGLYIKADDRCIVIIGNTAIAIQQALWIYLEQLGFRYLLPGEIWEQIPSLNTLYKKTEILTRPDYDWRGIGNGHGYANSKKIENDFKAWMKANRMDGSFPVSNGHSYDEIMTNNAAEFKKHPEYFAGSVAKGTLPAGPKFNVANKDLVKLVAEDAVKRLETYKKLGWQTNMISMEPSDGGGFCNTPACLAIGTPSDQAFYLTNAAAKEVKKKFPNSWVGTYAYNEHILPTKYAVEPNVFVMITNGFNRSKYSTEELLSLWGKKAKKTGVYEYLNVYEGSMDMPGQMHISNTKYLSSSLKKFYKAGATAYSGESTIGWVSKAVGNYALARLLWDVNSDVEAIKKDFYQNAFGSVGAQMRTMMDKWESYPHKVPTDNDLADWLRTTDESYKKATDNKIRQRINQVKIYLHYMVLFRNLKRNPTEDNYTRIVTYANKTFETAAFATLPTMVSIGNYSGFKGRGWYDTPEPAWKKEKQPFTESELERFFQDDLKTIKKTEGIAVFNGSSSFVKLSDLVKLPIKNFEKSGTGTWGNTEYIFQVEKKSEGNFIEIISGHAAIPFADRYLKLMVYKLDDANKENAILTYTQEKKLVNEKYSLGSLAPGYYRLRVTDEQKMFILKFSAGINFSITLRAEEKLLTSTIAGYNTFYFFAPTDIKKIQVSTAGSLKLESPSGRIISIEGGQEQSRVIDIQTGETGVWRIFQQAGTLFIDGIPPYLGTHPATMLVPAGLKK